MKYIYLETRSRFVNTSFIIQGQKDRGLFCWPNPFRETQLSKQEEEEVVS